MVHLPRVEATLAPLALLSKTVYLPWIKLEQPDARLIRLSEKTNNWTFDLASAGSSEKDAAPSSWSFRLDNILFDRGKIAVHSSGAFIRTVIDCMACRLQFTDHQVFHLSVL